MIVTFKVNLDLDNTISMLSDPKILEKFLPLKIEKIEDNSFSGRLLNIPLTFRGIISKGLAKIKYEIYSRLFKIVAELEAFSTFRNSTYVKLLIRKYGVLSYIIKLRDIRTQDFNKSDRQIDSYNINKVNEFVVISKGVYNFKEIYKLVELAQVESIEDPVVIIGSWRGLIVKHIFDKGELIFSEGNWESFRDAKNVKILIKKYSKHSERICEKT
jgi:hypothetical protein